MTGNLDQRLDVLTARVEAIAAALGVQAGEPVARHGVVPDRLTPAEVMRTVFATTRLATGYSIEQVDAFMLRAAQEIAQLTEERDAARERLRLIMGDGDAADGGQGGQAQG